MGFEQHVIRQITGHAIEAEKMMKYLISVSEDSFVNSGLVLNVKK